MNKEKQTEQARQQSPQQPPEGEKDCQVPPRPPAKPQEEQQQEQGEQQELQDQQQNCCQQLETQLEQLQARYTRLAADFDNHRKRTERQQRELIARAGERLICDLIPVLDSFEHALESAAENPGVVKGVQLIREQMLAVLRREGLEPIEALGKPFDPQLHEACSFAETDGEPENTVVKEIRRGYILAGKVIRPSMVQVSKNKEEDDNGQGNRN